MIHFLRLFAAFREIEQSCKLRDKHAEDLLSQVQQENAAKVQARERVRELEADNLQLRIDLQRAQDQRVVAVEAVADWLAQSRFGISIFNNAPKLPEKSELAEMVARGSAQARRIVDEQTAAFYREYAGIEPQAQ